MIGTHNVRGINKITDQDNLIAEIKGREINIIGISETKLSTEAARVAFATHSEYKCFASSTNNNTYGSGVAIVLKKELAKHIGKIDRIDGRIIVLHLFFKKCKLYIIQIYLPSNKKESYTF